MAILNECKGAGCSAAGPTGKTLLNETIYELPAHVDIAGGYPAIALAGNPTVAITDNAQIIALPAPHVCVSALSKLELDVYVAYGPSGSGTLYIVCLHNGGNALRVWPMSSSVSYLDARRLPPHYVNSPGLGVNFSPTVRMGQMLSAGAFTVNGNASVGDVVGNAMKTGIRIREWG